MIITIFEEKYNIKYLGKTQEGITFLGEGESNRHPIDKQV